MANDDARLLPLIDVGFDQIRELISPVLEGRTIGAVVRVDGGLINTIYRVALAEGGASLSLRVCAAGQTACERERNILERVRASLPVAEVLLSDCGAASFSHPYLVYRWIEGITLNECRRQALPAAFLSLAEPLGRLLAGVAGFSFPDILNREPNLVYAGSSPVTALLSVNEERLRRGLARERLGAALADQLCRQLESAAVRLEALDRATHLVHGDLGGRNILVAPTAGGDWRVTGLIDWEAAFSGWGLWDIGSLFRYARRYSETFRDGFERGYRRAGRDLPADWWRTARLLDAIRQVETLNGERELSVVFAECRNLIEAVVADGV